MVEKTMRFKGTDKNLSTISKEILQKLIADGYTTQSNNTDSQIVIQARKEGVLRDIFAANRAFTIMIAGKSNDFTVRIGIGKFIQNLAVTAAEALVLSELFLAVDVPEMIWTKHVEDELSKEIIGIIGSDPVDTKRIGVEATSKQ